MAEEGKTPIPKSQLEISNDYVQSRQTYGVPNEFIPLPSTADNRTNEQVVNPARASQISVADDTSKPFTIGLRDIDETIKYYFDNVIKPVVSQNGARVAVPVIYGSPERWKSVQRDGYYRDKGGKIMAPLIMYKRTSIERNRNMTSKIDADFPQTYAVFQQKYSAKNSYNQLSVLNGATPVKEYQAVVIPDFVTLNYSCMIYTYYMEQLNKILEAINYAADSYWGDPQRFKFRAGIGSYQTITELNSGQQRTVKGSFEIKMNGYLIPDVIQKDLNAIKKFSSTSKIVINEETVEKLTNNSNNNFVEGIDTNL